MAATYDVRTYVTLEESLTRRLVKAWKATANPIFEEIATLCREHAWDKARQLVPTLDLAEVGTENREWIKYQLRAMAIFGAGQIAKGSPTFLATGNFDTLLNRVTSTILLYLEHDATTQVQEETLQLIAEDEQKAKLVLKWEESQHPRDKDGKFTNTTDSDAFREWFGDSKVVDEHGAPLRVFHGTKHSFETFEVTGGRTDYDDGYSGRGYYFANDPKIASLYAGDKAGAVVLPVYLRLVNPLIVNETKGKDQIIQVAEMLGVSLPEGADGINVKRLMPTIASDITAALRKHGYDGVIYTYRNQTSYHEYMVLDPQHIKSASGNSGAFDIRDARITKSEHTYGNTQLYIRGDSDAALALNRVRGLIAPADLAGDGLDVDPNHVTVRYGIEDDDVDALRAYIANLAPFWLAFDGVMSFPASEHSDGAVPVVARVVCPTLHFIHKEIKEHASFIEGWPTYRPHCTLAYVKEGTEDVYTQLPLEGKVLITSITISHKNGVQESIPFGIVRKFNPHHDAKGRFATSDSRAAVITKPSTDYTPVNAEGLDTEQRFRRADGTYTPERQALHDAIIAEALADHIPVTGTATAMVLGGGTASGKSNLIKHSLKDDVAEMVTVDADGIRAHLPEYKEKLAAREKDAAAFTHEEASHISKQLVKHAIAGNYPVLLDGTGDTSVEAVRRKTQSMRDAGYEIHARYVTVDTDEAVRRSNARGDRTGRYVPESFIRGIHAKVSQILPELMNQGLFTTAELWDTGVPGGLVKVASSQGIFVTIHDQEGWDRFLRKGHYAHKRGDGEDPRGNHDGESANPPDTGSQPVQGAGDGRDRGHSEEGWRRGHPSGDLHVRKADKTGRYVTPFVSFDQTGSAQLQLISSLNASRLATWGFTGEAQVRGITRYRLTNVMDGRTSEFCRIIHGKTFEVDDARAKVDQVLQVTDPSDLRTVQPWPSQTQEALTRYRGMTSRELTDEGLHIPPFHPRCRTVCMKVGPATVKMPPPQAAESLDLETITMETLKELGLTVTQRDIDHWNAYVGTSPVKILSMLSGKSPEAVLSKELGPKAITFASNGDIAFKAKGIMKDVRYSVGTVLDPYSGTYYLTEADFVVGTAGAETALLKRLYKGLIEIGAQTTATTLVANVTGNVLTYARMGFLPDAAQWQTIRLTLLDRLEGDLGAIVGALSPADRLQVRQLLESRHEEALGVLVDLQLTVQGKPLAEWLVGDLTGTFALDMSDPLSVAQAKEYLS